MYHFDNICHFLLFFDKMTHRISASKTKSFIFQHYPSKNRGQYFILSFFSHMTYLFYRVDNVNFTLIHKIPLFFIINL